MAPSMSVGARNVPPQRDGWRHPCAKLAAAGEVPAREVTAEDASAGDVPAREAAAGDAAAGDTDARDTAAVRDVWRALRGDREYRGPDTEAAREAWRALRRYGGQHPSPNAGRCEAAFAGALGIRLGGTNVYHGITETRPGLGDGRPPDPVDIPRAIRLSRNITLAATAVAALIALSRPQPARGPTT
ncbi:MAG: cobalamin biosynthesis protein [Streptosporangiaceae bacterium]|nr:cobalamin biosynthesis protein [Streptosporangiaceae bacterium]